MAGSARAPKGKNRRPSKAALAVEQLEDRVVPSTFASTANNIGVFEDQLPNLSGALVQFMATHTDGTQKQTLSQIDQFRAVNPNYTLLHYQLGTGNSTYDYIINNQWSNDFSTVNQNEDWFAHQTYSGEPQSASDLVSGRVTGNGFMSDGTPNWYQADIANPAWQQYTLNQVLQNMAATGSNGWFADSFTYGMGGAGYNSPIPTRYQGTNAADAAAWPGGITWTDQLHNWAQTVENAFSQYNTAHGTAYQFIPNLDARVTAWEPNWVDNASGAPIMDGAFLEGFGMYSDTYDWTLSMNRGLNFTDNDKIVIMQPYFNGSPDSTTGQQERNFYMGTYLLLKGDETYLNMMYGGGAQYFPEYQLNLGAPTTPLPSNVSSYLWNGVYRRDFQNGFVLVNPGSTSSTLNLGGTYQLVQGHGGGTMSDASLDANGNYIGGSLTYTNMSSITMAGGTAAIFLNPVSSGPTVATAAAGSLNAAGTSAALSVLGQENGSDTGLTYTWTSSGPAAVSFSANGTNAAKNTTATFAQAGSYTFTATITDGSSRSVTSSVVVTVDQTLSSIKVTPSSANVTDGGTQQFSATGYDQFGNALTTAPAFTWSLASGSGTVSGSGLYTAPATGSGSATVQASSGTISATASVNYAAPTLTVATAATASANPVTGTSVNLSVLGQENGSDTGLTYTWTSSGPASVAFSANGTNTAKNTTASFTQAGTYTFTATITDTQNQSVTSSIVVTVNQTLTKITVTPSSASLVDGTAKSFTASAADQFGHAISNPALTWSLSGSGTLSATGLYTAPASGSNTATVTAASGSVKGTASVTTSPLAAPSNFKAAAGNAQVTLTWTASAGATSYNLYRSTTSGGEGSTPYKSSLTGTSFTDTGLTNGTTYYYKIQAVNTGGAKSSLSAEVSAKPTAALPSPWSDANIGSPGKTGTASYGNGTFTVSGGGVDVWGTADQFNYAYQTLSGDGTLIARVTGQQNTNNWAKAGIMIRSSLNANAPYVFLFTTPGNGTDFQYRTAAGASSQWSGQVGATAPEWVKLVRSGNTFTGYTSPDGATWARIGSVTVTMNTAVDVGLAVTAHNNSALSTATFTNVQLVHTATPSVAQEVDWVKGAVPAGAAVASDGGDSWRWVSSPTLFAPLASQSNLYSGEHQHYFSGATSTLSVGPNDTLFAYVYLNPANPPSEIMLQWNVGGSWNHRAYWGANNINWGTNGTASRYYMGALPATGGWVRLAVPASAVGLQNTTVNGMAFTLYGGQATWDIAGKTT